MAVERIEALVVRVAVNDIEDQFLRFFRKNLRN